MTLADGGVTTPPQDVADMAVFLSSARATQVTGSDQRGRRYVMGW